jgi:hypothetical protein
MLLGSYTKHAVLYKGRKYFFKIKGLWTSKDAEFYKDFLNINKMQLKEVIFKTM